MPTTKTPTTDKRAKRAKPPRRTTPAPTAKAANGDTPATRRRRASKLRAKTDEQADVSGRDSGRASQMPAMRAGQRVLPTRRWGQRLSDEERAEAKEVFLEAFAEHANMTLAADMAGVDRETVRRWRERDEGFKASYAEAEQRASDVIRRAIHDRAIVGWYEPVVSMGEVVRQDDGTPWVLHKYDSTLLQKLAAARLPEWRPQQDVTVNGGVRTEVVYVNDWRRAMQSGVIVPATAEELAPAAPAMSTAMSTVPALPESQPVPAPSLGIEVVYASPDDESE